MRARLVCCERLAFALPLILAALLPLALVPACAASSKAPATMTRVKVASTTLPASASVYVAHEKGYFREQGIDDVIEMYPAGKLALGAMLEGKADFATSADTPIARAVVDGKDPVVIATVCEIDSLNVIVARRDRGIATAKDLKGKRLGIPPGTSADFFQHIYLVTSGVDPKTVTLVPLEPGALVSSLASGTVDAICAFAPYDLLAEKMLGRDAAVLDAPGLYRAPWNVSVRREIATKDGGLVVRFLRAIVRANAFIVTHPAETQKITAKHTGIPLADLRARWTNNHWTLALDQTLILSLEDQARWMTGTGSAPDFLRHVDTSAIKAVSPDTVGITEPKD